MWEFFALLICLYFFLDLFRTRGQALYIKNNDPFGFKKAIDTSVIDKLTPKELDEAMAAAGLGLSRSDFSDDGADLQDLKEIYEGNGS